MSIFLVTDLGNENDEGEKNFIQSRHNTVYSAHKKYNRQVKQRRVNNGFAIVTENESLYNLVERTDDITLQEIFSDPAVVNEKGLHRLHLMIQCDINLSIVCFEPDHVFEYGNYDDYIHWDELFQILRIDSLAIINK